MALLTKSATYTRTFLMVLSTDHLSAATGKTVTVTLSKAGAAFGAPSGGGTATEISSGWYKIAYSTTDTNTAGDLSLHATATACDDADVQDQVVTMDILNTAISAMAISSVSGAVGSVTGAVGSVTAAVSVTGDLTATMKTSVENAVWDAARSSHVATGTFGQLGLGILRDNTATAGAAGTITLDAGASTTADFYKGAMLAIYSGTGSGQAPRTITAYSTGRVATISPNWAVTPDSTSKFIILAFDDPPFVGTDGRVLVSADSHTAGATIAAVTGRVTANADQWAGTTIPAPSVTGVPKVDVVDIAGATVSTSSAQLGVNAVQIGAAVPGSATIGTTTNLSNAPTAGDFTSVMKTSIAATVWDASRVGHLATGTFGQLGQCILRDNTATAGAASTITLDASASTTVDQYKGDVIFVYSGTGFDQCRVISAYSAGRVATVVPAWVTTPDNTSKFIILAQRTPLVGTDTRIVTSADSITSGETVAAVTGAVGSVTGAVGSVTGAVGSVTGAVGSVTGNVGGNVAGSVASVTADVGITQTGADKAWSTTTRALTDKVGFALSSTGIQAIWDFLTSAATTVGSMGKRIADNLNATISGQGNPTGSVVSGTNSATTFKTDRTETVDDYWKNNLLTITSGALIEQVQKVSAYNGTTKEITVSAAFTGTPADGVTFMLVNR